ncbi:MAG: phosphopantetheine-binding protein, partial [Desulfatirhabdiaceae bacterium]|nr:phosphopantetheine-binding protein [Desulfatirhabdiaceae bacterium]
MTLKTQLKKLIVEDLNLADIRPEDIGDDEPLFGDKFGLDSIDAVELVFQLKTHFGVEIKNMKEG